MQLILVLACLVAQVTGVQQPVILNGGCFWLVQLAEVEQTRFETANQDLFAARATKLRLQRTEGLYIATWKDRTVRSKQLAGFCTGLLHSLQGYS